jgi:hypothetical protein
MLPFFLDARGVLGVDGSLLMHPLATVGCFSTSIGDSYCVEDRMVPEMYDLFTEAGLHVIENAYQIAIDIEPPSRVSCVMVQGRVGRIQFRMNGSEPDLVYHSRETEPTSKLDAMYGSLTAVNLGCKMLCRGITLHLEPMPGDPRVRFRPVYMCENVSVRAPNPLGALLKASEQTKDFTISTINGDIRVHKVVLSVSSEFFCKCIQYSHKDRLEVSDSLAVWAAAVGFMYYRTVDDVAFQDLLGLVRIACEYLIGDLMIASSDRLTCMIRRNLVSASDDIVAAMSIARRFSIQSILNECTAYIQDNAQLLIMDHSFIRRYALLE